MLSITTHDQSDYAALVDARPMPCTTRGKFPTPITGKDFGRSWTKMHAVNHQHSQRAGTT